MYFEVFQNQISLTNKQTKLIDIQVSSEGDKKDNRKIKNIFKTLNLLIFVQIIVNSIYLTRAIIPLGLYIFYPLFEGKKQFFKGLFS